MIKPIYWSSMSHFAHEQLHQIHNFAHLAHISKNILHPKSISIAVAFV